MKIVSISFEFFFKQIVYKIECNVNYFRDIDKQEQIIKPHNPHNNPKVLRAFHSEFNVNENAGKK